MINKLIIPLLAFILIGNKKADVENEIVDLNAIKNVIENDNLSKHLQKKKESQKKKLKKKKN